MKDTKKTLYRIPDRGKVAGVCAGIADYFNIEVWLVRVVTASMFLLGGYGIVIIIYALLWMILDSKPVEHENLHGNDEIEIKKKAWQSGKTAQVALQDIHRQMKGLEVRLQALERHVTSDSFELKNQINNL